MIMLAIAALVVATPLTMVSQATSDSSIGLGLGDGETTWAEASETGGTIDSILLAETDIAVTGVTLDKNTITLAIGGTYAFTATVSPSDATNKSIKWSSSNKAVATVDENGVVTAVGTGQITLSATTTDGNFRAFCTVKVTTFTAHATGVYLDKSTMNLQLYGTGQLTATVLPADATNKNVTWSSSNKMVANADATGKVIGITPGTATITVTTAEGGFTATCVVTVSSPVKEVTLDYTSMTINLYGTGKLTATVLPAAATNKDVTWSSSARMVVNVDASGKLTGVSLGTATITVKTVDGNKTATCEVTVVPKGPVLVNSVELDEKEMTLIIGSTGQLTATVLPVNAADKSVTWSSSNTAAA
ncbi:MAG: Ig-like domain-containing protein, partial [Candidatus Methanoplasma sp.]|nr:Ig-like domain-containing protein [Candidatus Methanoplasma sp.]